MSLYMVVDNTTHPQLLVHQALVAGSFKKTPFINHWFQQQVLYHYCYAMVQIEANLVGPKP